MPKSGSSSFMSIIREPLGVIVLFIIMLVLSGLTIATAIKGSLTAAAVSGAGLLVLIVLVVVISALGKD